MTEGEKAINIKLSLSLLPSRLRRATYCPLAVSRFCLCGLERRTKSTAAPTDAPFIRHRRRSHTLPVRGRLYFHIIVNSIAPESSSVFVNSLGGSKPPPYRVGYKFQSVRQASSDEGALISINSSIYYIHNFPFTALYTATT